MPPQTPTVRPKRRKRQTVAAHASGIAAASKPASQRWVGPSIQTAAIAQPKASVRNVVTEIRPSTRNQPARRDD
jgi:hypothetical protein